MSDPLDPLIWWLCVFALVVFYVCVRYWQHVRAQDAARREREMQTPGTPFEVASIAPQVKRLRQDYVEAAHARSNQAIHRPGLLSAVRRMISTLAYFHREGHGTPNVEHTGDNTRSTDYR